MYLHTFTTSEAHLLDLEEVSVNIFPLVPQFTEDNLVSADVRLLNILPVFGQHIGKFLQD